MSTTTDGIDIKGIDKASLIQALYKHSMPLGMGVANFKAGELPREKAEEIVSLGHGYIDYLQGRVMKIWFDGDTLNPMLYDRDNGDGAAYDALAAEGLI